MHWQLTQFPMELIANAFPTSTQSTQEDARGAQPASFGQAASAPSIHATQDTFSTQSLANVILGFLCARTMRDGMVLGASANKGTSGSTTNANPALTGLSSTGSSAQLVPASDAPTPMLYIMELNASACQDTTHWPMESA